MRFSIRFNPTDPRHVKATQILNMAGRRKASIVANALWEYDLKHGLQGKTDNNFPDSGTPQISYREPPTSEAPAIAGKPSDSKMDDTLQNSIMASLADFRDD